MSVVAIVETAHFYRKLMIDPSQSLSVLFLFSISCMDTSGHKRNAHGARRVLIRCGGFDVVMSVAIRITS
jgi:hypothetical protein